MRLEASGKHSRDWKGESILENEFIFENVEKLGAEMEDCSRI